MLSENAKYINKIAEKKIQEVYEKVWFKL
jgi:hypothetical protein